MEQYDLFQLRDNFDRQHIMICFNGPFFHSIIEELGKAVRNYLQNESLKKSTIMDVFSVFIEQTQNVRNYATQLKASEEARLHFNKATVIIGKDEEHYLISSGNLVMNDDLPPLIGKLELLNSLDKNGLRALYKEQMRKPLPPNSTGAGLGLIDIARKASQRLHYRIQPVDQNTSFFSLQVAI